MLFDERSKWSKSGIDEAAYLSVEIGPDELWARRSLAFNHMHPALAVSHRMLRWIPRRPVRTHLPLALLA